MQQQMTELRDGDRAIPYSHQNIVPRRGIIPFKGLRGKIGFE